MTYSPRCGSFLTVFGLSVLLLPVFGASTAKAQELFGRDGTGIIWFVGTVQHSSDGQPTVDLGDAHGLDDGVTVSVFRPQDMHFRPLGVVRIENSFPSWAIPAKSSRFELKTADVIIYVRTLAQLKTGNDFRDTYLRQQLIKTGTRNGYSTVLGQTEAEALQTYISRQAKWVRDFEHVAGTIRSKSAASIETKQLQSLLRQVMHLQLLNTLRVPVEESMGPEWQSVVTQLLPAPDAVLESPKPVASGEAASDPAAADSPASETPTVNKEKIVEVIERRVENIMYVRLPEERKLAKVMCVALETINWKEIGNGRAPANERQWFMLQIQRSQFPALSDDVQFIKDLQQTMTLARREIMESQQ